jgi:hypothetical protein
VVNTKEEIVEILNARIVRWKELVRVSKESAIVKDQWGARISELETVRDIISPKPQIEEKD